MPQRDIGGVLVADPNRIGTVTALGLDEVLFGPDRAMAAPVLVDVDRRRHAGQLLDVIEGRSAVEACRWLSQRDQGWLDAIEFAVLDLSGPWRLTFDTMLPDAIQMADPFHLVKVRHEAPCVPGRMRGPPCRAVAAVR